MQRKVNLSLKISLLGTFLLKQKIVRLRCTDLFRANSFGSWWQRLLGSHGFNEKGWRSSIILCSCIVSPSRRVDYRDSPAAKRRYSLHHALSPLVPSLYSSECVVDASEFCSNESLRKHPAEWMMDKESHGLVSGWDVCVSASSWLL